jgi:hypothetical protein
MQPVVNDTQFIGSSGDQYSGGLSVASLFCLKHVLEHGFFLFKKQRDGKVLCNLIGFG